MAGLRASTTEQNISISPIVYESAGFVDPSESKAEAVFTESPGPRVIKRLQRDANNRVASVNTSIFGLLLA